MNLQLWKIKPRLFLLVVVVYFVSNKVEYILLVILKKDHILLLDYINLWGIINSFSKQMGIVCRAIYNMHSVSKYMYNLFDSLLY